MVQERLELVAGHIIATAGKQRDPGLQLSDSKQDRLNTGPDWLKIAVDAGSVDHVFQGVSGVGEFLDYMAVIVPQTVDEISSGQVVKLRITIRRERDGLSMQLLQAMARPRSLNSAIS